MDQGFSFASVILSYFLVGGGLFAGTLLVGVLKLESQIAAYLLMAAGAFVGGFVAARASRGSTIIEPAIGAVAVIGTIVGLAAGTDMGQMIWHVAHDETVKFVAIVGATSAGGAIAGAFISEKVFGDATHSPFPWILYTGMAVFGASLLATIIGAFVAFRGDEGGSADAIAKMMIIGIAVGCFVSGIAVGASARTRPLGAAFLGGAIGVAGFFALISKMSTGRSDQDAVAAIAVLAAGGAIATLLGSAIGWAVVGKRYADS